MEDTPKKRLDLASVRERLAASQGPAYWRCLEELADDEEFLAFMEEEFPQQARPLGSGIDRRRFLTLSGAALALAGLSGCRFMAQRKIVPYVERPDDEIPGKPMFYATAVDIGGYGHPVVATSREGRPIKLDGNPDHPASLGATDAVTQATLLNLYDPDRAQTVTALGEISSWEDFYTAARRVVTSERATGGAGIRILTGIVTSPTLYDQIGGIRKLFPGARWHRYEAVNRYYVYAGSQQAFGRVVDTVYHFDKADRILSLGGDFLLMMPGHVRYARDFADRRRVHAGTKDMNRLYVVEATPTNTGAMADHRVPVRASDIDAVARAIAAQLGVAGATAGPLPPTVPATWIAALVRDLQAHRGTSVVVVGDEQPPGVHALAHAMNAALGAAGATVSYTAPVEFEPTDHVASLNTLVSDMDAGKVSMLLILGGNPVYDAPADVDFRGALRNVPLRAHLSMHPDETTDMCHWQLPQAHALEAWSDTRSYDGTASIIQPLIAPLYDARSAHELLAAVFGEPMPGLEIVRGFWETQPAFNLTSDPAWEKVLHDGLIPGTAAPAVTVALAAGAITPAAPVGSGMEIIFRPDPWLWDGRYANNPWLQELPRPLTKLVWDNAALMSPNTAEKLRVAVVRDTEEPNNQVMELKYAGRSVKATAYVLPGHPDDSITLNLGYGRWRAGKIGENVGCNAYVIRTAAQPWFDTGLAAEPTGETYELVATHMRNSIDMRGRDPVQHASIEQFLQNPSFDKSDYTENPPVNDSLYSDARKTDHKYVGFGTYQWGMSIDNNVCIGCHACEQACYAENNIPSVGKDQVRRGREMTWIRVDRYYSGSLENPVTFFQPVPCMQCENAPCEPVCPVGATVHSHEGLNMMVYNRCVGTRYCSNNCPYKVRRFNFYKFTAGQPNNPGTNYDIPIVKLSANPEVTVRGRGVMEKCTYCVQRIDAARIEAKKEERELHDGEIQTACQQACPTNAIVFGNIEDHASQVYGLKNQPHDYSLLADLNTRPRTTYLAKFSNPNPEIQAI